MTFSANVSRSCPLSTVVTSVVLEGREGHLPYLSREPDTHEATSDDSTECRCACLRHCASLLSPAVRSASTGGNGGNRRAKRDSVRQRPIGACGARADRGTGAGTGGRGVHQREVP